jgi:hypothetical protein
MSDPSLSQIVSVLQVGFAGWVAYYLLTGYAQRMLDISKNMATMLEVLNGIRMDLKEHRNEVENANKSQSVGPQ